jgi:hypothetical protein
MTEEEPAKFIGKKLRNHNIYMFFLLSREAQIAGCRFTLNQAETVFGCEQDCKSGGRYPVSNKSTLQHPAQIGLSRAKHSGTRKAPHLSTRSKGPFTIFDKDYVNLSDKRLSPLALAGRKSTANTAWFNEEYESESENICIILCVPYPLFA